RGRVGREEAGVDLVDLGEGRQVGHVDREAQRAMQRRARRLADGLQVLEAASRLCGWARAHELAAGGIQGYLPRAEQQAALGPRAEAHGVAVGADRRRRPGGIDRLALASHRWAGP